MFCCGCSVESTTRALGLMSDLSSFLQGVFAISAHFLHDTHLLIANSFI